MISIAQKRDSDFPKEELCFSPNSLRFLKRRTSFLPKEPPFSKKRDSVSSKESLRFNQIKALICNYVLPCPTHVRQE
ncbi:hypothetical protein JCM6292_200 [Bacteroides pyogenes JCM 6292]|uniref:Uncharacterized protein n=1 Tax=Bacteroides pyogenes JCM 6292 TaxID=1235809 RepID=W4P3B4_9BACE|nr:hypothetical protein JCM6292_200 [Bacteroides pyogenes JCM 6292]